MTTLEELDAAERALSDATAEHDRLVEARDSLETAADEREQEREALETAIADAIVDEAIGKASSQSVAEMHAKLTEATTAVAGLLKARDVADRRVLAAEKAEENAAKHLAFVANEFARPLFEQARIQAREAYRTFVRFQALWGRIGKVGDAHATPTSGNYFYQHGAYQSPESLWQIAWDGGVVPDNCAPRNSLMAVSLEELRELAAQLAKGEPIALLEPSPPTPVEAETAAEPVAPPPPPKRPSEQPAPFKLDEDGFNTIAPIRDPYGDPDGRH